MCGAFGRTLAAKRAPTEAFRRASYAMQEMAYQPGLPQWKFFADVCDSNGNSRTVAFLSEALLWEGVRFASRASGPLRACCDATHDFGAQKWKLVALGFLGTWRQPGEGWSVTMVPLGFCVTPTERAEAVQALIDAVCSGLLEKHGFDLKERVGTIYLDGGVALQGPFRHGFPRAQIKRCLQHVKKNIVDARGHRKNHNVGKVVKEWVQQSVFFFAEWPFPFLLDAQASST